MAWLVLLMSGLLESVWAVALGEPATAQRAFGIALIPGGIVALRLAGVESPS